MCPEDNIVYLFPPTKVECPEWAREPKKPRKTAARKQKPDAYNWEFKARFRRGAFGWKSQPAVTRIKQAVSEISKVARKQPEAAAEGAVIFLEKISPAIEKVDSSSGSIGSAVNKAIETLVPVIASANVDQDTRREWLERLWMAILEDQMPYIEKLGDHWGELCQTRELANYYANEFIGLVRAVWSDDGPRTYCDSASACLSSLLKAERYDDLFELLKLDRHKLWHYQQFGVQALAHLGKVSEAIEFAEASSAHGDYTWVARTCEEILLNAGRIDEAYERYAFEAHRENSYLATYRKIAKNYPSIDFKQILKDLIASSPGEEYKWFATAKELGELELASELASKGPCDPRTLSRAARDHIVSHPQFALDVGLAALYWLFQGYGYDITSSDVWAAHDAAMQAAQALGCEDSTRKRITESVQFGLTQNSWVAQILSRGNPRRGGAT